MSLGVAMFFCLLVLYWYLYHLGLDSPMQRFFNHLVDVLGNILMLPVMFIIYPGLLIFSIIHCIRERFRIKSGSFWSLILLLLFNPFFVGTLINTWAR